MTSSHSLRANTLLKSKGVKNLRYIGSCHVQHEFFYVGAGFVSLANHFALHFTHDLKVFVASNLSVTASFKTMALVYFDRALASYVQLGNGIATSRVKPANDKADDRRDTLLTPV